MAKELEDRKDGIIQLKSDIEKKDIQIENLWMKQMGANIVETKLNQMGNTFFKQVSFLMNKYTEIITHLDFNVDKLKNVWLQINHDVKDFLIQKNNFEFVNFFKSLKDLVEGYEFNKNKVNLDIFKHFVDDYEQKKHNLDVEIEKKRIKDVLAIDLRKKDAHQEIKQKTDTLLKTIEDPKA